MLPDKHSGSVAFSADVTSAEQPIPPPPNSPNEQFSFNLECEQLPYISSRLDGIQLPVIRETGVKACIDYLSEYFDCSRYKISTSQFWFLDIFTDWLWRLQDEYYFPEEHQKLILQWLIYVLNLIRNNPNMRRREIFKIFREAIGIAETNIQTGVVLEPPEKLFALVNFDELEGSESSASDEFEDVSEPVTPSSISVSSDGSGSCVALEFDEEVEVFKLPKGPCANNTECLSTDVETPTNSTDVELENDYESSFDGEENKQEEEEDLTEIRDTDTDLEVFDPNDFFLANVDSIEKDSSKKTTCSHATLRFNASRIKEEEVLKAWFEYHMWQRCIENMDKSSTGCFPEVQGPAANTSSETVFNPDDIQYWKNYMAECDSLIKKTNEVIFINMCAVMAIKQMVLEYFYESFQFLMISALFNSQRHYVTQRLNEQWFIPKRLKSELKRPKPTKQKTPKKDKKSKKGSKSSKSSKKSKKSKKSVKSSKKSKSTKSSKKSKDKKPKKLTKEEKEELARRQREQELLEEQMRMEAENKVFMFPLVDAANEEFYKGIFPNWTPPKADKGKKGKAKGKGKKKK
ncbi:uncharacterized protein LOC109604284 [Aethina tumida]|uniref:uncharacterized protein LOC109604284 n=1 Tax=Aethina tumida TaxID=116153 RepID=UPI00096AF09B|nr:uncharacterized protein LOC109604284 [Aethina tumida]